MGMGVGSRGLGVGGLTRIPMSIDTLFVYPVYLCISSLLRSGS